jgi:hypothetical protein
LKSSSPDAGVKELVKRVAESAKKPRVNLLILNF